MHSNKYSFPLQRLIATVIFTVCFVFNHSDAGAYTANNQDEASTAEPSDDVQEDSKTEPETVAGAKPKKKKPVQSKAANDVKKNKDKSASPQSPEVTQVQAKTPDPQTEETKSEAEPKIEPKAEPVSPLIADEPAAPQEYLKTETPEKNQILEITPNRHKTMLFPLRSANLNGQQLPFLDELLAHAFAEFSPHDVLTSQDIEAMVEQRVQQQILGCVDESCGIQLAGLVGARYLIRGSIHAVGESSHILLTLIDTQEKRTVARSRATGLNHHGKHPETMGRAVRRLYDLEDADSSLAEQVYAPVLSGSRVYESSLMAPAWNITLTGRELRERGYVELSEIFNDLPGIDVARPQGASWLRTYWRGRRDTWQDHFLFLIDGIPWHDHLYGNARMLIPLSNIDRVEIFYGPGSLMHGSNALMGIVQVITRRELRSKGTHVSGFVGSRVPQNGLNSIANYRNVSDINLEHIDEDFRLSLSTRFDHGRVDSTNSDTYEWSKDSYYGDPRIWGESFLQNYPGVSGSFRSPYNNIAADLRVEMKRLEIGFQYYNSRRGTGYQFAADRYQNAASWSDTFYSIFARTHYNTEKWTTNLIARYRGSIWPNGNSLLLRSGGVAKLNRYVSHFTSADIQGEAGYTFEESTFIEGDQLSVISGVHIGRDDLGLGWQKVSSDLSGDTPPSNTQLTSEGPLGRTRKYNLAGFALIKYMLTPHQRIDVGIREEYRRGETNSAFRLAYVGHAAPSWTWKLLYGRAFTLPVPRQVTFASKTSADNNLELFAEQTTSVEAGLYYNEKSLSVQVSPYLVWNDDVIDVIDGQFQNASQQQILGIDIGVIKSFEISYLRSLRSWVYLTWLPWAKRAAEGADCDEVTLGDHISGQLYESGRECRVGDIAPIKIWAGSQIGITQNLTTTLLARFYSKRPTVSTNPVEAVDAYATMDISMTYRNLVIDGLNLGLRIGNLFNAVYFHPGVSGASAGNEPGSMVTDAEGVETWSGSQSGYSSLLPQPSRSFQITLQTDLD